MQTNAKAFACNKAFLAFAINKKPEIGFLFIAARLYGAIAFLYLKAHIAVFYFA